MFQKHGTTRSRNPAEPAAIARVRNELATPALLAEAAPPEAPPQGDMQTRLLAALPDGEMQFHTDGAHRESPYRATTLYAIKIPSKGGDTLFANLYKAYEALPEKTKNRIEKLVTTCVYDYEAQDRSETVAADPILPRAQHRLVKTHPASGQKSLYLSRLMTQKINEIEPDEGEELLMALFDHAGDLFK